MGKSKPMGNITHYQIFDFWKDKCIDKYGNVYVQCDDNAKPGYVDIVIDWGEPNCWCCGKIIPVEEDSNYEEWITSEELDDEKVFKNIWNNKITKHFLERAHIKPRMLGGQDIPENMFLMCHDCHAESPDLYDPKGFLMFVYRKRRGFITDKTVYKAAKILKETYGITAPYFNQKGQRIYAGLHGGNCAESTKVYAFVLIALKNRVALRGDLEKMFFEYLDRVVNEFETEYASHFSNNEIDKKALEIIRGIRNAYETFKTIETNPNTNLFDEEHFNYQEMC